MSLNKEELRALLVERAEEIIEDLLGDSSPAEQISLEEIEEGAMGAGGRFQALLTQALIEVAEAAGRGSRPRCPQCGEKMRHHGYRDKVLMTRTGEVKVRRAYYRCEECGQRIFPPG